MALYLKFFHLSDLHIGRRLNEHSLRDEQKYILHQVVDRAVEEKPDAVVIAGDVFDKADPAAEAVSLFNQFISDLTSARPDMPVMIISGNHDSCERIDLYKDILDKHNVYVSGSLPAETDEHLRRVTLHDEWGPVHFYLMPFVRPGAVRALLGDTQNALSYEGAVEQLIRRENLDPRARNVLISHQFYLPAGKTAEDMDKERTSDEVRKVGNVDAVHSRVLAPFAYAALGHIHKPMDIAPNARYCGTPLQYSLSEAGQDKSISLVTLEAPGEKASVDLLPLEPKRPVRKISGRLMDVVQTPSEDYVFVTLTDEEDLDAVEMSQRLTAAFPFKLGYIHARPEHEWTEDLSEAAQRVRSMDPLSLCLDFLGNVSDDERALLEEITGRVLDEAN